MAMHSKNYLMVKRNYDKGLWTKEQVYALVGVPKTGITEAEYEQITGEPYVPENRSLREEART